MCGINVILIPGLDASLSKEAVQLSKQEIGAALDRMLDATAHRGPDGRHWQIYPHPAQTVGMGVSRLALRGGAEGAQPYRTASRGALAYNGETFWGAGQPSDTKAFAEYMEANYTDPQLRWYDGPLREVEGMWAAAYLLRQDGVVVISRDPFGIKPLFKASDPKSGISVLSSEVAGIAASGLVPLEPSPRRLAELLTYRCVQGGAGLFNDVGSWPPYFGRVTTQRSYGHILDLRFEGDEGIDATREDVRLALHESLLKNIEADRPVGLMLSGGIDSGLLAYMAAEEGIALPCFTTQGPEHEQAKRLAAKLGHLFHSVDVPRGTDDWLAFLRHSPAPIADPGGYMTWCVARAAKAAGVPVLLSGAGADEIFLGYRRHAFYHRYKALLTSRLAPLLASLDQRLYKYNDKRKHRAVYRRLMAAPGNLAHYLNLPETLELPAREHRAPSILWQDLFSYLPDQVLAATDLYSMAHSVEVRVPYLTRKLLFMAWGMGVEALLKEGTKTPLRQLFAQYGGTILPKTGFGPTEAQYPNFHEMDEALGLDKPGHPIYAHLPFAKVAKWRSKKMGLQARMAFWCAGIQMAYGVN